MNATLTLDASARLRRPGMVWGVAVSVVLHLLLIFGYRMSTPKALPELPPKERMTVWLTQPKPPAPVPAPAPAPVKIAPPQKSAQQPARKQTEAPTKASARQPAPAAAETTASAENPQPITPPTPATAPASSLPDPLSPPQQQQQQQQQQSQRFDMNAALKTARKVANEKDPARAGTAVAQLDDHPLYPERTETELATKVATAKRKNCLDQPGTLLTPLFWLLDKKDHGCKL